MRAKHSDYLTEYRPIFRKLLEELLSEYSFASILVEDTEGTNIRVSGAGELIEPSASTTNRGYVIRFFDGHGFGEYAANHISMENIPHILDRIRRMCPLSDGGRLPEEEALHKGFCSELSVDPKSLGEEQILKRLRAIRKNVLKDRKEVTDCMLMSSFRYIHKLYLSQKRELMQDIVTFSTFMGVYAQRGGIRKELYRSVGGAGGAEHLNEVEKILPGLVRDVVDLLGSEPITPGVYTCLCSPDVTGLIAHESFGHGVEADMYVKNRAMAAALEGEIVASPLVRMRDSGRIGKAGAYFFDDEGNLAGDTLVIKDGRLVRPLSDGLSADRLGIARTGNGRRQSYDRKAYARMTNTWFEAGSDQVKDMIANTSYGFLLDYVESGMEDPKNWGIQCVISMAREIRDGKLTGRICSPCIMTGSVPELLKSVDMVSDTVEFSGASSCGKGFKEMITVSTGGPWMRARVTLG